MLKRQEMEFYTHKEEIVKEVEDGESELKNFIENIEDHRDQFIGDGKTAEVFYWSARSTDFCVKIISEKRMNEIYGDGARPRFNSPKVEAGILEKLRDGTSKVKVPELMAYMSFIDSDGLEIQALLMEKVDAVTLKDIHFNIEEIPEGFSVEEYFKELEKFLKKMHSVHKIHHRDIAEGNLMIDRKTGMPIVIDFGDSTNSYGAENDREIYSVMGGLGQIVKDFPKDLVEIKGIKRRLEAKVDK